MTAPLRARSGDRRDDAFDRAVAGAARSLVLAPLPGAVLDAPRPTATRSWLRLEVPLAAAAATVILAIGLAVGSPKPPATGRLPVFRSGSELSYALRSAGLDCRAGAVASPGQPRMEAAVCAAATGGVDLSVVVSQGAAGAVGEVHLASDIVGPPTAAAERAQSARLAELIGLPFADPDDAAAARAWLASRLPLDPGRRSATTIDGTPVALERVSRGGLVVVLGDLRAGLSPAPSR